MIAIMKASAFYKSAGTQSSRILIFHKMIPAQSTIRM